ncbi:MAG: M48 family metalloprotease [Alphaproteobacteria bacterium]|nr:M48 family metalloprotease [Alphaproteobacteria bacterium]
MTSHLTDRNSASQRESERSPGPKRPGPKRDVLKAARLGAAVVAFAIGQTIAAAPAAAQTLLRDAEIEEWLDERATPLLEAAGIQPDRIEILLIGDPTFNAFAGGHVMGFHTGMLTTAETPNQVEAVIAHEVGHIAGGHTARSDEVISTATAPMLLSLVLAAGAVAAGAPQAGMGILGLGQNIGLANYLKYSRGQEASADSASLEFLEKLGKSGEGALEIWRKLRNTQIIRGQRINPYQQTHPLAVEREEALRERVESSPYFGKEDSPEEVYRLKMIQAKIYGFLQDTKFTLRQFPESDASDPARYARAVAYYRGADLDKARAEIDALIEAHPDNPYFHELKGQMLFEFGHVAESIEPHRKSVELDPTAALLRVNLGRALLGLEDIGHADEAITELKRAVLLEKDNAFAWFELSRAYGLKGDIPMAHLATAESKYQSGQVGEAAQFAQRALEGLPQGSPDRRRAQDILAAARARAASARNR